jgi:hypothetical protein
MLHGCIDYWQVVSGASDAEDESYARFLRTPPGDCEAFRETWPEHVLPSPPMCEDTCVGDVAFRCRGALASAVDCTRLGTSCRVERGHATCGDDASDETCGVCDPTGRAIGCLDDDVREVNDCGAFGLECFDDPDREASPACTVGRVDGCPPDGPICDGTVALLCASDGHVRDRIACDRLDMVCRGGRCEPPGQSAPACDDDRDVSCDGTALSYCLKGENRYLDCTSLGFTGCFEAPVTIGVPARAYCTNAEPQ